MTKILRITPTDPQLEDDGVWTDYAGVQLKIAAWDNIKYIEKFEMLQNGSDVAAAGFKEKSDLLSRSMAGTILVDWKNFDAAEYSEENAENLLLNDKQVNRFVSAFSRNMKNYLPVKEEDVAGKSSKQ